MWLLSTLLLGLVQVSLGFSCVCAPAECEPLSEEDCPPGAGTVWDPCGCCRVCARAEGEPCGGPYGFFGTCGKGLQCVVSDVRSQGVEGTCKPLPGLGLDCKSPETVSGCNVIAGECICGSAPSCPGQPQPYTFRDVQECGINLEVMREHARQRDIEAGLNCTIEDCEEKPVCPPDSALAADGWGCECQPSRCAPAPLCQHPSHMILTHRAEGIPGDCCDVHECVYPQELNCTGVVCPNAEEPCPEDSYALPRSQSEGECCSRSQGCACLPGPCPAPTCPPGEHAVLVRPGNGKPATCCPQYKCWPIGNLTCLVDGREMKSGTHWKKRNCIDCSCNNGLILCSPPDCPEIPPNCPSTTYLQDECCPKCSVGLSEIETGSESVKPAGCKLLKGIIHTNGAVWQEDECTTCTCIDGTAKCQAEMCHQSCQNATYIMGECCPRCHDPIVPTEINNCSQPVNCSLTCEKGFVKDLSGCSICRCQGEEECHLKCESGFLKDGSGREICECANECPPLTDCSKKCKHGLRINKTGCEVCECEHCKPLSHCFKKCPHGLQTSLKGCPICKCKAPGSNDTKVLDTVSKNECLTESGIKRDNGEAWFDNCRQCYCFNGREMCSLISCPKVDCPDPIFSKDTCCRICPGEEELSKGTELLCYGPGGVRHEVESWKQGCLECVCHNGSVLCHSEPCPPVLCEHPLQGECCPVCPQESEQLTPVTDSIHSCDDKQPGEKWRQNKCSSCICINGEAVCYTQTCDPIDTSCKTPVQLKNQCCPVCFDNLSDEKVCQVGNVTFNIGDEWEPEKCTRCSCGPAHTISCTQTICERPCSKMDNPCCPKCTEVENSYDWVHGPIYMTIVSFLMFLFGAASVLLWKHCPLKRHKLKICQPTVPSYQYKYVPTYEQPVMQNPQKSPV